MSVVRPSDERCPDCGRKRWQHTPVEDFPCGARTSNSNDDYLQKLRDAHPMECYRKALQKIASKRYGCCGADRIAQEALGNEATGNETEAGAPVCIEVGNWYSEYECPRCKVKWVQNDDAPTHKHTCAPTQKAEEQRPNVFTHGLTLSKTDIDDICGTGDLYGGKALLACGCIDICTNQRDHLGWSKPPSEKADEGLNTG